MTPDSLNQKYLEFAPQYSRLKDRVIADLIELLEKAEVPILNVEGRVKDYPSFLAKCDRKSYSDPFNENEDFLGLRIIVYFPDDVVKVADIIDKEFIVKESQDKLDFLNADQFGYRSIHKIVSIKKKWATSPGYRGLENLKCEIQIRTVLMHTWAEIEHKLQYKSTAAVPKELRRKFSLLSAQLETADNQFQQLQKEIFSYRESLPEIITAQTFPDEDLELNIETLRRYLRTAYPDRKKCAIEDYQSLIDELQRKSISTVEGLDTLLKKTALAFDAYEASYPPAGGGPERKFADVGMVRISKQLFYEERNHIKPEILEKITSLMEK